MGLGIQDWLMAFSPRLTRKASTGLWGLRQGAVVVGDGTYHRVREFLPSGTCGHWGPSLQGYRGRGIASCGRSGADGEAAHVGLTVAVLLACFTELELSVFSSSDVIERLGIEGLEMKEMLPILLREMGGNCVRCLCFMLNGGLLWFFRPWPYAHTVYPDEGEHLGAKHLFYLLGG